jgi:hypothetical protein
MAELFPEGNVEKTAASDQFFSRSNPAVSPRSRFQQSGEIAVCSTVGVLFR